MPDTYDEFGRHRKLKLDQSLQKSSFSAEKKRAESSERRGMLGRGGRRPAHRAQVGPRPRGAGAAPGSARARRRTQARCQRVATRRRGHAQRLLDRRLPSLLRGDRRPHTSLQTRELFHGAAMHETSV